MSFLQSATDLQTKLNLSKLEKLKMAKKHKVAAQNAISSTSEAGMSDADVECYKKRYSDLNGKPAREHYKEIGEEEGRLNTCAIRLTEIMAARYLH